MKDQSPLQSSLKRKIEKQLVPPLNLEEPNPNQIITNQQQQHRTQRLLAPIQNKRSRRGIKNLNEIKIEEYDQRLRILKSEFHGLLEENTKLKTKHATQNAQIKSRDKFIDELLKFTLILGEKMGLQSSLDASHSESIDLIQNARQFFNQNFVQKGPYQMLRLKK